MFECYTVREFEEAVAGKLREWQLFYDLAAWTVAPIIAAAGEWDPTHRPPTVEDLLGRPMLSLDPRDDQDEEDDLEPGADDEAFNEETPAIVESEDEDSPVRRGRYTREQMAAMHRGEPVS